MGWPGEKVLVRVIDTLEKGIGGALRPWQTRRVGKANAEVRMQERLLLEQVELDIADLKAGRKKLDVNGKLIACDVSSPMLLEGPKPAKVKRIEHKPAESLEFAQAAHEAAQAQEMQQAVNLKKIALYAEEEAEELDQQFEGLEAGGTNRQPDLDADWFAKWRTGAQEVSKDEMQRLWGKLLAGEVATPGSYSMHTIEFLSRMSSADAAALAHVAPFVTSIGIIKVTDKDFKNLGLTFSHLLYLDDLGLINGTNAIEGITWTLGQIEQENGRSVSTLDVGRDALVFFHSEGGERQSKLKFNVYTLTRVGREVLTLASFPIHPEYLKLICDLGISQEVEEVQIGTFSPDRTQVHSLRTIAKKPVPN
ncbi:DUF2806 domain-containing protein [Roseinatronobacter monicus]|uniref:Uncharacterized protein DUF2806 n=1 Tax=Roseinatronobacter monicus TaxID=393481 RepID=A0A543K3R9_9RHOB|nr:DUF2806 domain-containing protein [Roseinatronobacter monicus]TQM89727.1 uncharacterized protein DUF2806 [Roseinatronobacter monicus]